MHAFWQVITDSKTILQAMKSRSSTRKMAIGGMEEANQDGTADGINPQNLFTSVGSGFSLLRLSHTVLMTFIIDAQASRRSAKALIATGGYEAVLAIVGWGDIAGKSPMPVFEEVEKPSTKNKDKAAMRGALADSDKRMNDQNDYLAALTLQLENEKMAITNIASGISAVLVGADMTDLLKVRKLHQYSGQPLFMCRRKREAWRA